MEYKRLTALINISYTIIHCINPDNLGFKKIEEIRKIIYGDKVKENTNEISTFMADFVSFIQTSPIKDTEPVNKLITEYREDYFKEMPYILSMAKGLLDNLEKYYSSVSSGRPTSFR